MSRKFFVAAAAILLAATLSVGDAYARAGGGGSSGSRGSRSFSMPSATPTAPRVSPFDRAPGASALNPGLQRPGLNRPGFFGGGFGRGFMGGLIGAGLLGLLFGHGLFGGLGGIVSMLGLLLQIGLIVVVVSLAIGWFRRRQHPQPAFAGGPYGGAPEPDQGASYRTASGPLGGGSLGGGGYAPAPPTTPINIEKADYDTFEARLSEIQDAYGRGDLATLRLLTTPEMAENFAEELAANTRRGVVDKVSGAKLIQGDLSEAWQESDADYASVAMRYSVLNPIVDQASGRVVSGSASVPEEVTEVWTFQRPGSGTARDWQLSAIQQAH